MKINQLLRKRISIKIIVLTGILLFSQSVLAQDWFVWKRTSPCRDSRQDWFSVAKTFPGFGFDAGPVAGPMEFAAAMSSADAFKMGPAFRNYCCLWDVYKNNQTGAFSVGKQFSSVPPAGFILFRSGICCEEAFALAGFAPGNDCRSLQLSTGAFVTIQPGGTFIPFIPIAAPPTLPNNINCWPGSTAALNPTTKRIECYCNPGLVWTVTRTACVDPGDLVRNTDCSGFPGSYAAWNDQNQRVECFCPPGKVWNASRTACIDNVSPVNCWPGSTAALNPTTNRIECYCNPGLVWNATRTACVDSGDLVRNTDCSGFPGSYAAWSEQNQRVECFCKPGYEWNATRTACVLTQGPDCNAYYANSEAKWNPQKNVYECYCKPGYDWNATRTACVLGSRENPPVDPRLQKPGVCNTTYKSGANEPEQYTITLNQTTGSVDFAYSTYTVKDRIHIYQGSTKIFDSGCVGTSNRVTLTLNGSSNIIRIVVDPKCEPNETQTTQWDFNFGCPR